MGPDDKICYCYHVPYRKLWHFACRRPLQRASQLSECLGAGTGCGWCIPVLKKIFERAQQVRCAQAAAEAEHEPEGEAPVLEMTPEEYAQQRQQYIREKRPRHDF